MLTSAGFKRMRVADYVPTLQEQARELYGEDADVSELTPLGKFIYLIALQRAEDNELAEQLWNSRFVDTSEGASLEQNVKRALITKKKWLKATGEVVVNLEKGAKILVGDLFRTPYNVYFKATTAVTAPDKGDYRISVEALEYGIIGNVEPGDISIIANPQIGINSVTNPDVFLNGQDEESDEELQDRYYQSLSKTGTRRIESIEANVLDEVAGVRNCVVIENATNQYDKDGRPPHSFETVVFGGNDVDVAKAIFAKKPGGIRAYGTTYHHIFTDERGLEHMVSFTRATTVTVHVRVHIKKNNQYPIDGDRQVISQVVRYIGGTYDGTVYVGVGMSADVVVTKAEARVLSIDGIDDVMIEFATDGANFIPKNVVIGFPEVAETDESKVEVLNLVG